MGRHRSLGVLLIGFGLMLLLAQTNWLGDHFVIYLIALGFFTAYNYAGGSKRYGNVGFLIPGSILLAIGIHVDLDRVLGRTLLGPGLFFLLLAGAFYLVYQVHTRKAGTESANRNWPIYPATALLAFALFVSFVEQVENWRQLGFINYIFPLALIGVGLFFIARNPKSKGNPKE